MADITREINAFRDAVYGEEVRSSMISAIEKINSETENNTTAANAAASNADRAADSANSAAASAGAVTQAANTAATNAGNAARDANYIYELVTEKLEAGELTGPKGDKGDKGETGESGVIARLENGFYTLTVDADGNLYVNYPDDTEAPRFQYDQGTGGLYYIFDDEN